METQGDGLEIGKFLKEVSPDLRRITFQGWGGVAAIAIIGFAAAIAFAHVQWSIFSLGAAVFGIIMVARHARRSHEAVIMPHLARTAGFSYEAKGLPADVDFPDILLPKGGVNKVEDRIAGKIGGLDVVIAEYHIETGGKNSSTLFDGFVIGMTAIEKEPEFRLVLASETEPRFLAGPRFSPQGREAAWTGQARNGKSYKLFLENSSREAEDAAIPLAKALISLEDLFDVNSYIYSAVRNAGRITVAIRHKRDLFRMGGLFASRASIEGQVHHCFDDLKIPLQAASKLIEAQGKAA